MKHIICVVYSVIGLFNLHRAVHLINIDLDVDIIL
jgi:hypothetical protein